MWPRAPTTMAVRPRSRHPSRPLPPRAPPSPAATPREPASQPPLALPPSTRAQSAPPSTRRLEDACPCLHHPLRQRKPSVPSSADAGRRGMLAQAMARGLGSSRGRLRLAALPGVGLAASHRSQAQHSRFEPRAPRRPGAPSSPAPRTERAAAPTQPSTTRPAVGTTHAQSKAFREAR